MAINFPSNPTNAQEVTEGNVTYVYNATKGYWESSEASSGGASITVYADMTALIAATGMSDGDQAFVTANNNLYIYSGTGWYKIATVQNDSPSAITGVDGTYSLAIDGTPTVITAVSTDPEGFPLTWSYSTSGLGSIATVSQVDNVFTITPSTDDTNFGTFTLTINATDGVNGAVSTNTSITLQFYILNSNYTTLLATVVDTSDNNNITDSSTNNHTITANGDAHAGTFSPYRHGGYSTYFDGSGDYLTTSSVYSDVGTGDFTAEAWVYIDSGYSEHNPLVFASDSGGVNFGVQRSSGTNYNINLGHSYFGSLFTGSNTTMIPSTWYHIAVSRSSGTIYLFIDGQLEGTFSNSSNFTGTTNYIGAIPALNNYDWKGYITDARFVSTALYTTAFDPPTKRLLAVANTELLTCHLPYFADGSSNNYAITVNGNTKISTNLPYDNLEYSESTNGGSVYFDGTGDALVLNSVTGTDFTFGTGDFTIEAWVYPTTITNSSLDAIFTLRHTGDWNGGDGGLVMTIGGFHSPINGGHTNYPSSTLQANMWTHLAFVRSSGTLKIYRNGLEDYSAAMTHDFSSSYDPGIGVFDRVDTAGGRFYWTGHITDVRVKKSAEYTSNFSPPTSPLSSTGSVFHLKGTDASIIDKSQVSNLKLVGNTTGSTTQVKFAGSQSIYFDGSGDSVSITPDYDDPLFNFGTVDWTIEVWAYIQTLSSGRNLISFLRASTNETVPHIYTQDTGLRYYVNNTDVITSTNVLTLNTWHHIALTRNGNDHKLFVDGTQVGNTWTSAQTYVQGRPVLGDYHSSLGNLTGGTNLLHGYAQDFRITKGLARYTANFTPPTEPLKG